MKSISLCLAVVALAVASSIATAQIEISVDDGGKFVLTGNGEQTAGMELRSAAGYIVPGPLTEAAPFVFALAKTPNQIAYASLH